jgi:tRNA dimethylallyltransferase
MEEEEERNQAKRAAAGASSDVADKRRRIACIVGATGSGKTKLSIDVATRILEKEGEKNVSATIVNLDALQVHGALPIATARVREEEKRGIAHELFGVVDVVDDDEEEEEEDGGGGGGCGVLEVEEEFARRRKRRLLKPRRRTKDVRWFRESFLEIVEKIWEEEERCGKKGSVVICVGGTPYYAKAAMLKTFLPPKPTSLEEEEVEEEEEENEASASDASGDENENNNEDVDKLSADEKRAMHERLRELDPKSAARLHPKDARRVRRYLQIAEKANGDESLLPSTLFQRQQREEQLMFPPHVMRVIHLVAENDALEKTLERRLEQMRRDGVENEIKTFVETYPTVAKSNKGVAQAIGVREFLDDAETLFVNMSARTKRLARRQRRQFANMIESSGFCSAPAITIDATRMHEMLATSQLSSSNVFWEDEIVHRATEFILDEYVEVQRSNRDAPDENDNAWIERACKACGDRIFRGDRDWLAHTSSKRHKNRVRNLRKSREGQRGSLHPNKIAK